jgi:hypothetical protein
MGCRPDVEDGGVRSSSSMNSQSESSLQAAAWAAEACAADFRLCV